MKSIVVDRQVPSARCQVPGSFKPLSSHFRSYLVPRTSYFHSSFWLLASNFLLCFTQCPQRRSQRSLSITSNIGNRVSTIGYQFVGRHRVTKSQSHKVTESQTTRQLTSSPTHQLTSPPARQLTNSPTRQLASSRVWLITSAFCWSCPWNCERLNQISNLTLRVAWRHCRLSPLCGCQQGFH